MATIGKMQNVIQSDPKIQIDWPKIMQTYSELTSIEGVEDFVKVDENAQAPQEPPSATSVQMPGGQVHEVGDLVKLYSLVQDPNVKNAILQAMQLPPEQPQAQPQEPVPTESGHMFNDPHVAQAADGILKQVQGIPEPPGQQPTVTSGGSMFHDPVIGQVADSLVKSAQTQPTPTAKPAQPTKKG